MKLLTDEHFPVEIATAVRRETPNCDIQSIHETNLAGLLDQPLLEALDLQQRTLLTRDVNSIPDFLKERLRDGKTHGGVIYVSGGFRQNEFRAVIRALIFLSKRIVMRIGAVAKVGFKLQGNSFPALAHASLPRRSNHSHSPKSNTSTLPADRSIHWALSWRAQLRRHFADNFLP